VIGCDGALSYGRLSLSSSLSNDAWNEPAACPFELDAMAAAPLLFGASADRAKLARLVALEDGVSAGEAVRLC
jgi:hypothetical protein